MSRLHINRNVVPRCLPLLFTDRGLQYASMNSPELDQQFFEAVGSMEIVPEKIVSPKDVEYGIYEYDDITTDALKLHDQLIQRLMDYGDFNPDRKRSMERVYHHLNYHLDRDFVDNPQLKQGATILAHGPAIVLCFDRRGNQTSRRLDETARLHGTISHPIVLDAPILDGSIDGEGPLSTDREATATQIAAMLRIEGATYEILRSDRPHNFIEPLGEDYEVFLPLNYDGLKIKRRTL